jgi:hypothetical protein
LINSTGDELHGTKQKPCHLFSSAGGEQVTFHRNGDRWTLDCSDEEAQMILVSLKKNDDIQTESLAVTIESTLSASFGGLPIE